MSTRDNESVGLMHSISPNRLQVTAGNDLDAELLEAEALLNEIDLKLT